MPATTARTTTRVDFERDDPFRWAVSSRLCSARTGASTSAPVGARHDLKLTAALRVPAASRPTANRARPGSWRGVRLRWRPGRPPASRPARRRGRASAPHCRPDRDSRPGGMALAAKTVPSTARNAAGSRWLRSVEAGISARLRQTRPAERSSRIASYCQRRARRAPQSGWQGSGNHRPQARPAARGQQAVRRRW